MARILGELESTDAMGFQKPNRKRYASGYLSDNDNDEDLGNLPSNPMAPPPAKKRKQTKVTSYNNKLLFM
jgi:hypothetical protein